MEGLTIGFEALISLLSAIVGALTVWYNLKGKVSIQQVVLDNIIADMTELKEAKKEGQDRLHKRVDDLKKQVEKNREKNEEALADIKKDLADVKTEMGAMELRIIQEFHKSKS